MFIPDLKYYIFTVFMFNTSLRETQKIAYKTYYKCIQKERYKLKYFVKDISDNILP